MNVKLGRREDVHLNMLVLMMLSFILRMGLPQLKYIFFPLFLYFVLYTVYHLIRFKASLKLNDFISHFWVYMLLLAVFFAALIYKSDFFLPVKEFASGLLVLAMFYLFYHYLVTRKIPFARITRVFERQIILITAGISLTGMVKWIYSLLSKPFPLSPEVSQNALTTSISLDYNFFALAVIFGLFTVLYKLHRKTELLRKEWVGYNLLLLLYSLTILFSQSRRGFLILLIVFFILLAGRLLTLPPGKLVKLRLFRRNDLYLSSAAGLLLLACLLMCSTSGKLKNQIIKTNHLYQSDFRLEFTNAVNRYASVIGFDLQQTDLYHDLWYRNSKDMHGFSKSLNHWLDRKFLKPIDGWNALSNGDFSSGLTNWKLHKKSDIQLIEGAGNNAALIKASGWNEGIGNLMFLETQDTVSLNAYVKIIRWDKDLRLQTIGRGNDTSRSATIRPEWEGDDNWHSIRLSIPPQKMGTLPVFAGGGSFSNPSISLWTNFSVSKGKDASLINHIDEKLPSFDARLYNKYMKKEEAAAKDSQPEGSHWDLQKSLSSNIASLFSGGSQVSYHDSEFFAVMSGKNNGIGRRGRWQLALNMFNDYSLPNMLFGKGFSYLNRFGEEINGSSNTYEYPHNPLISAFLYSGILGAVLYVFFLFYSVFLYVMNFGSLKYFFILFVITVLYVTISGNSHFSIPAFNSLSVIPWLFISLKRETAE